MGAWPHIGRMLDTGDKKQKQCIVAYLQQATRNRLVFCHKPIKELVFVNLGKTLATILAKENLRSQKIAYSAEDSLAEILSHTQNDLQIGNYVALDNIGILFEPELGFNIKSTLDNASTNKTIIIHSDGVIQSDIFYFFQPDDDVFIDLKGLSYIEI